MAFRILFPNKIDIDEPTLVSLTATSEDPDLPVSHLQEQSRGRIWRTAAGVTAASVKGDWSGITTVGALAFMRHNMTPNATTRLRLFAGAAQTGAVLYDSGTVSRGVDLGWGNFPFGMQAFGGSNVFSSWSYQFDVVWLPAPVTTSMSFQYDVSDPANPSGYIEASRLYPGEYFELSEDASRGSGWWWEENTVQRATAGGTLRSENNAIPGRRWEIKLGYLTDDDFAKILELSRAAGMRMDMFVSAHPGVGGVKERDGAGLVKIVELPKPTSKPDGFNQYEASIVFKES